MTERHERETEYSPQEKRTEDPAGRPEPYVEGPTGPAPLGSELRGDPDGEGQRRSEAGAVAGAIAGTSLGGPLAGVAGAVTGGAAGAALEDDRDDWHVPEDDRPGADETTHPRTGAPSDAGTDRG